MSEILDIINDTVQERTAWTGDPVTHVRTNTTFIAEIDGNPDALTIAAELGEDYRNVVLLHLPTPSDATRINQGDKVTFRLFGNLVTCQIIKRRDSGAQVLTDFWAQQLTPKDQQ